MSTESSFTRSSVARVATARPARYGKQLASHMGHKITTSWDAGSGTGSLSFDRTGTSEGTVALRAEEGTLVLELSTDQAHLAGLEQVTGIHLARFGFDDQLVVAWVRDDGTAGSVQGPLSAEDMARHSAERAARKAREAQEAAEAAGGARSAGA